VRFFDEQEEADYAGLKTDDTRTFPIEAPVITGQGSAEENPMAICRRIGPFRNKDSLLALMAALENDIDAYQIRDEKSTTTVFRVTTETLESREAAVTLEAEMKQAGVKDIAVIKRAKGFSVSLGLFSKEQSAQRRQASMKKLGYESSVVKQELNKSTYWAEVTAHTSGDELSERVAAADIKGTDNLLYQSCTTEILASVK
jgi:hypothetical protein